MSSAQIVTDQSFDQWPSARCLTNCHSDVASTHQYLVYNFNRFAPIALPRFCNSRSEVWDVIGSHRLCSIIEVWHLATKLHDCCMCTVRWAAVLLKLKLVPCLWLHKNIEYTGTRMIGNLCAKNCRKRWSFGKAIAKNKTVQFLPHVVDIVNIPCRKPCASRDQSPFR